MVKLRGSFVAFVAVALCLALLGEARATGKAPATSEARATKKSAEPAPKERPVAKERPVVVLETSMGSITLELDAKKAPKSVQNFLEYVRSGHYDGTVFHRVIDGFMIQGGGFTSTLDQKPTRAPISNEADNGLKNDRGTIAMARTSDPNSATAQFFINVSDNDALNHRSKTPSGWGYTVFGRVTDGMKTVDAIKSVKTGAKGPFRSDVPAPDVVIKAARIQP